ncbi:MAG: ATP-binding cassette domain-containing protein [Chloroflexota bacterium]|nr:ATP-binding cassette domain-containing protein [Chloroflexota bacterium]MDE2853543.1 ATP-binding cassette domain-containing protein [Chloroflexota bacterium]MDE2945613.1 ATP-binding cassette domain-containing protein [Chloroflexota bacterium]
MATNGAFLICDDLYKIFKVADIEVMALQGLDLTVKQGELVGVVGASGSGKTTLMNVLGGLTRPSAGQVIIDGKNLLKLSTRDLTTYRQVEVGFVWQQGSRNLIPYLSALDNIKLPMTLAGGAGRQIDKRARELMDLVDLSDRYDHNPIQLSGGEQQRVAIAVALANGPKLLLADEPTGELDSTTSDQVYTLFKKLNRDLGLTICIVSHDPDVKEHVGRVVAIRDGKLASETVKRRSPNAEKRSAEHSERWDEQFEELIVLDSAGRLQIPKQYREQLGFDNRVEMEVSEDSIVIRPAKNLDETSSQGEIQLEREIPTGENGTRDGLISRFRRKK